MSVRQLSIRERTILIVFIMVCCVYAVFTFIYQPSMAEVQRLNEAIRLTHKKINDQARVIAREKQVPQWERQALDLKMQTVADQEVVSGILSEIEQAARAMNIRVVEMKPQAIVAQKNANVFSVSLALDGNFKELMAFIHGLQAPEHDLSIAQCFLERTLPGESVLIQAKIVIVRRLFRPIKDGKTKQELSAQQPVI